MEYDIIWAGIFLLMIYYLIFKLVEPRESEYDDEPKIKKIILGGLLSLIIGVIPNTLFIALVVYLIDLVH